MSDFIKRTALIVFVLVAALILIFTDFGDSKRVVRYDCRDAHWHPDVPVDVKRECQKLMYEFWQQKQEEQRLKKMI